LEAEPMKKNQTSVLKVVVAAAAVLAAILLKTHYFSQGNIMAIELPKRTVEITYDFTISEIPKQAEHMRIWVPVPPANEHQTLNDMNVAGNRPYRMVEESQFGNRFLVFDLNDLSSGENSQISFSIKFCVTRYAISALSEQPALAATAQDEPALYLAANRLIPIDGKIAEEAKRVAGNIQDPHKQARLLYDHIVETVRYDKSGSGWGRGDAVYACDARRGNCTDFHSLFIGQARALGIPARFIMGLPLPEDKTEGIIAGYHCWGEFYLKEKGWRPVDASEANKFPQKREQFFGGLDENRVAFTAGRDIKLPGSSAEPLNYVIYPHVEIDCVTCDNVKTSFFFKNCLP
jgi:hypothetical protein